MNFELTSGLTLVLIILCSLLLLFGTLLAWQKLYRRGFLNFTLRFLLLALVLSMSVSSIGVAINRSQGFYSSWSDLFGSTNSYSVAAIPAKNIKVLDSKFLKNAKPIGKDLYLLKEVITGKDSLVSNIVYLILPSQVVKLLKAGKTLNAADYQVTEFLTGFPSQPEMWFKALKIEDDISAYNATHPRKIIGVIPEVNVAGTSDLECMNFGNGQPDAQTWLTSDMHSYLSLRLGIVDTKWVAAGVSTGAWCAAMFAIDQPNLYRGALSIAGYFRPALPLTDSIVLQDAMKKKYDVATMESKLVTPVPLYIVASLGDVYSIRETTRFLAKPHPLLDINYHEIATGGHNPRVWKSAILPGLEWIISRVN